MGPFITPTFPLLFKDKTPNFFIFLHSFLLEHIECSFHLHELKCILLHKYKFYTLFPLLFMVISRDLDEDGNLVDPSNRDEYIALCNYYYRNVRCMDKTIDCRLVELCMFDTC